MLAQESSMEELIIRCAMSRVALRNDFVGYIGYDYSTVVDIMDSEDVLRGR